MNQTSSTPTNTPARRERAAQPQRDRFMDQFDDADLERALRTVSWNPKDVANFLRSSASL
jgi:hypothetical protein